MSPRPAVFVDRDGIINELRPDPVTGELEAPLAVSDVALIEKAPRATASLEAAGFILVGVTNQPSAAKGKITLEQQDAIHARVIQLLADAGVRLSKWMICPHHPEGIVSELSLDCECRKPRPGMLLSAARDLDIDLAASWMIGDSDSDIEAGLAVGTRTILVGKESSPKRRHPERASFVADDIESASTHILHANAHSGRDCRSGGRPGK